MRHRLAMAPARLAVAAALLAATPAMAREAKVEPLFHDSHFHLTNYVQEGISIRQHLETMGDLIPRSTVFGIPVQQTWDWHNSGRYAPTYYLQSDAPLYYYSFTDAFIARAYLSHPDMAHVYLDISWDEVATYATSSPEAIERTAAFLNRHSNRVLFGTDNVAPKSREAHLRVYALCKSVFDRLPSRSAVLQQLQPGRGAATGGHMVLVATDLGTSLLLARLPDFDTGMAEALGAVQAVAKTEASLLGYGIGHALGAVLLATSGTLLVLLHAPA